MKSSYQRIDVPLISLRFSNRTYHWLTPDAQAAVATRRIVPQKLTAVGFSRLVSDPAEAWRAASIDRAVPIRSAEHQAITEIVFGTPGLQIPPLPG